MRMPNVCWLVATKDGEGEYFPENEVYDDFDEAIHKAFELLQDDPQCDPRAIQVILDPEHPCLRIDRCREKLSTLMRVLGDDPEYKDYMEAMQDALDTLDEEGGITCQDELEEGGKEPIVDGN